MSVTTSGENAEGWNGGAEFLARLQRLAGTLGKTAVEKLLVAYYVMLDKKTPAWAKARIAGALVYFGFPIDAIPDVTPAVGFTDDLAVLALALIAVGESIRWRHVRRARKRLNAWGLDMAEIPKSVENDDKAEGYVE